MRYCKAYRLAELSAFTGWADGATEAARGLGADDVVYLCDDLTVVRDPVLADQRVLWDAVTPRWRTFCRDVLRFAIPGDLPREPETVTAGGAGAVP